MRRYVTLLLTAIFAAVAVSMAISASRVEARECQLWASKPYRHCIRYAPEPTTTTVATTTTAATTTTVVTACDLSFRQRAYNDALLYYAGQATRDTVNTDAVTAVATCTDAGIVAAAQVVVDCFAVTPLYFLACAQPPENEVGYFAAALDIIDP